LNDVLRRWVVTTASQNTSHGQHKNGSYRQMPRTLKSYKVGHNHISEHPDLNRVEQSDPIVTVDKSTIPDISPKTAGFIQNRHPAIKQQSDGE